MKTFILLLLFSISVFAIPAKHTPTLVSQPDGTTFSLIGFGDEYYNFAETLDGYVIIQGTDNFWYYAELSPEGRFIPGNLIVRSTNNSQQNKNIITIPKHLRESEKVITSKKQVYNINQQLTPNNLIKSKLGLNKTQSTILHELVLCVQFPDLPNTFTGQSFQSMINDDGWRGGIGGMSKYYKDVSYNNLSLQADYQDWITAAHPSSYYADNNPNYSAHVKELVLQCIDAAYANGVDFSLYDNDGDGIVDGVFIIHSGPGAEESSNLNYIWSHQGGVTASHTYNGKTINKYIALPETYASNHVEIGVFCHEFGHMLGLPDTYDTDYETNGESEGVGNWCLMAGGSWGGNGSSPERPVHMSAFCKDLLGFTTPTVVSNSQALSIPQAETNSFMYKIWMDNNKSDEYMLIENRQKTGFDANLPGSGLLMYHVDINLIDIWPASNNIQVTSAHIGIKVYEADGLEQMATAVNRGNAGDPYPGSTNNTSLTAATTPNSKLWNNTSSGVEINNISPSGSTMTASAVVPTYNGYDEQFYRKWQGYSYTNSYHYGMVKCIPSNTGKLLGVRIISPANKFSNLSAAAFTTFNSNSLSSQVGSTVTGSSDIIDNFVQLNFSPAIDVTQNVPIYVRILFQTPSGYYVPLDVSSPATGNSYISTDGATFTRLSSYDIPVRVVFQNIIQTSNIALLSPNGGETWQAGTSHNITWNDTNVTNVKIEYTTNGGTDWSTVTASTSAATGYYSWTAPNVSSTNCKVKISDAANPGLSSISAHPFTIFIPNSQLVPVTTWPVNNANIYTVNPVLEWYLGTSYTDTVTYDVVVYDTLNLTTPVFTATGITATTKQVTTPLIGGHFYSWKVRSNSRLGYSYYSTSATFRIDNSLGDTPPAPVPCWPTNNAVSFELRPTFEWYLGGSYSGSVNYDIELLDLTVSATFTYNAVTGERKTITDNLTGGHSYKWHIRANGNSGSSAFSDYAFFSLDNSVVGGLPPTPVPTWPVNNTTLFENAPTLQWYLGGNFSEPVTYDVIVYDNIDPGTPVFSGTGITDFYVNVTSHLIAGHSYSWKVRTHSATQISSYSAPAAFNIDASQAGNPVAHLAWPTGGPTIFELRPILEWYVLSTPASDAYFEIEVKEASVSFDGTTSLITTPTSACTYQIPTDLTAMTAYHWRVKLISSIAGNSAWSDGASFTTSMFAADIPSPRAGSPVNGVTIASNTVNLSWYIPKTTAGDQLYRVELSRNPNMTSPVLQYDNISDMSKVINTPANGNYYWRVIAKDASGQYSGYSNKGSFHTGGTTSIIDEASIIPDKFEVFQNFPNPFNPSTTIKYGLPTAANVSIKVYNILGQEIKTLVSEYKNAGTFRVMWNGDNNSGNRVPSGIYIFRVTAGINSSSMKMILMK